MKNFKQYLAEDKALMSLLNAKGYNIIPGKTSKQLIVHAPKKERVAILKKIATLVGGKYTSARGGTGWRSSVGAVLFKDKVILAKPKTEGTGGNIDSLDARIFSLKGKKNKVPYRGEDVDVVTFTSAKVLEKSIIEGCRKSPLLGDWYADNFENFFAGYVLDWTDTPTPIVNKLGVYVGELLAGWVFLKGQQRSYFGGEVFKGKPKAFHMPTDPSFKSVDSFFETAKGMYGISSKFDKGAPASFFTGVFDQGMEQSSSLPKSFFKTMCLYATKNNLSYNKARDFVYDFGIRHILKLNKTQVPNPNDVFRALKQNTLTPEAVLVVDAIKKHPFKDASVTKELPASVSAFFNRYIADKLNKDKASMTSISEILGGKGFYQANLDKWEWANRGEVFFSINKTDSVEVTITGAKSPVPDVTCKQGWINYYLK